MQRMLLDDDDGISDEGFYGVVADTESSLLDIKKQLLTVQTLRTELCRKEDIIYDLHSRISVFERDESLSNDYYHENCMLIERSYQAEKALENSNRERSLFEQQLLAQSNVCESLRNEIESFSKELSDTRRKSDLYCTDISILNQKIADGEETLRISQGLNH